MLGASYRALMCGGERLPRTARHRLPCADDAARRFSSPPDLKQAAKEASRSLQLGLTRRRYRLHVCLFESAWMYTMKHFLAGAAAAPTCSSKAYGPATTPPASPRQRAPSSWQRPRGKAPARATRGGRSGPTTRRRRWT